MKITSIVARYLLGLMFTVFGLNGFLNFIHQPPPANPLAIQFSCRRQRVAFCRILLRDSIAWWAAVAFGLLRATCADSVGGGALQHPCVSPDACAGNHCSGSGGLCAVGTGLPSVPRKLQQHLHREACDAAMNCVAASFASPELFRNRLKPARPWRPAFDLAFTIGFVSRLTRCDDLLPKPTKPDLLAGRF